ncbi:MAG TPA: SMP-30/gluconolactonase/LRE family protein [Gemmataceae bacterium]|nr:SMP-30/gluconolactonase/LRE family protein [Gemmataceae bacterium]
MRTLSLILSLLSANIVSAADLPKPSGDTIVSPDAKLELLFTRTAPLHGGLTEGPAVAPDGSIYFSDIPFGKDKGMILRFDPKTKKTTVFTDDSHKSNGLEFDAKGYLIACEGSDEGGRCVSRWDVKGRKRTVIADRYQGKRFNAPNDLIIDRRGRIYFTDPRYLGTEPRELEHRAVYRIGPGDKVSEVTHALEKPNGIALSPDERSLYVADNNNGTDRIDPSAPAPKPGAMKVYAFTLDADGKVKGSGKVLIDFGSETGCDGMTVDAKGNLYLAVRSLKRPGIWVLNPDGKEIAYIPTGPSQPGSKEPKGIPSNCCFGIGKESKVLYVTVDVSLYRIPLKVAGYHIPFEK